MTPTPLSEAARAGSLEYDQAVLQRDAVLLGIVAASARFVPVPFVDDVIKSQARRSVVKRALLAIGCKAKIKDLAPLYRSGGLLSAVAGLPLTIVLFPVRKIVTVISALHGVPTDLLETFLLGRCVTRAVSLGAFRQPFNRRHTRKEARRIRQAFDRAFKGTNLKMVSSALGDAISNIKGLGEMVMRWAEAIDLRPADQESTSLDDTDWSSALPPHDLEKVERVLSQPEVRSTLEAFDARFDEAYIEASR